MKDNVLVGVVPILHGMMDSVLQFVASIVSPILPNNSHTFKVNFDKKIINALKNHKVLLNQLEEVAHLFNYNKGVSIFLCDSFEDIKRQSHDKRMPEWVIGCNKKNKIFILDPKNYIHKRQFTSIESLIVHEFVHIVINSSVKNCPIWLNEGFALWYADQIKEFDLSIQKFINPFEIDYSQDIYSLSSFIIKKLFENYSEQILIRQLLISKDFYNDKIFGLLALKELFTERIISKDG